MTLAPWQAEAWAKLTARDFERLHAGGCRGVRFNFVKHLGGVPDMDEFRRVIERRVNHTVPSGRRSSTNDSSPEIGCPTSVPYAYPVRFGSSTTATTRTGSRTRHSPIRATSQ
mgnify:CR=1 FL=1